VNSGLVSSSGYVTEDNATTMLTKNQIPKPRPTTGPAKPGTIFRFSVSHGQPFVDATTMPRCCIASKSADVAPTTLKYAKSSQMPGAKYLQQEEIGNKLIFLLDVSSCILTLSVYQTKMIMTQVYTLRSTIQFRFFAR
jgi:hypothetical protein